MVKPSFGDIYLVKTRSLVGRAIRFWTRSRYSHGGIAIGPDKGVEARWDGVRLVDLSRYRDSEVVILAPVDPLTPKEIREMSGFLQKAVFKQYDWGAIWGFLTFKRTQSPDRWYCFELINVAYEAAGRQLARLDTEFVTASTIYGSLVLRVK